MTNKFGKNSVGSVLTVALLVGICLLFTACNSYKYEIKDGTGVLLPAAKLLLEGQLAFDAGSYDVSIAYFKAIIDNYPNDAENICWAYYETGFVYFVMKDYKKASEFFTIVIKDKNTVQAAVVLATYLMKKIETLTKGVYGVIAPTTPSS